MYIYLPKKINKNVIQKKNSYLFLQIFSAESCTNTTKHGLQTKSLNATVYVEKTGSMHRLG